MRSRQDLVESFSTFLQFEGDRSHGWTVDPRLRRSMTRQLEQESQKHLETTFWALYWHQRWQSAVAQEQSAQGAGQASGLSTISANHLNAHVQEGCYWAAQKTASRFNYGISDCFQMAIAQFHKILRGFDSSQGSDFSTYASATFASLIRETLRQRQEVDICTTWGLLRKLSKKRLVESLQMAGLGAHCIAQYLLVWQAFKLHYVPVQAQGTRKLPKPDPSQFVAMAQFYNRERGAQLASDTPKIAADDIEPILLAMAKAARSYLYPTKVSINAQKGGQDSEFIDDLTENNLTETERLSPMEALVQVEIVEERQQQRSQLGDVLVDAIAQLDGPSQELLGFYYRDSLTQKEMAERLNIQQYTVSRRLTKIRKTLVKKLAQWSEATLHTSLDADLLSYISTVLEEWLQQRYSKAHEFDKTLS